MGLSKERIEEIQRWQTEGKPSRWVDDPEGFPQQKFELAFKLIKRTKLYNILDVGCFTGWFLRVLARDLGVKGVGVDIQKELMELMEKNTEQEYHFMSAEDVDKKWFRFFDGVLLLDVVEHVFNEDRAIEAAENVTRENGFIVINLPLEQEGEDESGEHLRTYTKEGVLAKFGNKKDFKMMRCKDEHGRQTLFFYYRV